MALEAEVGQAVQNSGRIRQDFGQDFGGQGPLKIDFAKPIRPIGEGRLTIVRVFGQMAGDGRTHSGVDHCHVSVVSALVDDGIVDDLSGFVQKGAVDTASGRQRRLGRTDAGRQVLRERFL